MANFRKGTEEIKRTANNSGVRKFTPNIFWLAGDVHTVLFVTPAGDIPKVRLHQAVRIPSDKSERGYKTDNFLCRKDPSMVDISGGDCVLCDHIGHDAAERFVALAIELEPIKSGKEVTGFTVKKNRVKREDGTEADYPQWGMVIQGAKNFFSSLAAYDEAKGDITKVPFEIQREGEGVSTKYHFFPEKGTPLPEEEIQELLDSIPDLESLLEDMGSDEKYSTLEDVEPGSQPSFGDKGNKPTTSATATSSRDSAFNAIRQKVEAGVESY
jgi:hypothetical protein